MDIVCFGNCFELEMNCCESLEHAHSQPIACDTCQIPKKVPKDISSKVMNHTGQSHEKHKDLVEKAEILTDGSDEYANLTHKLKRKMLKKQTNWL